MNWKNCKIAKQPDKKIAIYEKLNRSLENCDTRCEWYQCTECDSKSN